MKPQVRRALACFVCAVAALLSDVAKSLVEEGASPESAVHVIWTRRPLEIEAFQRAWIMERIPGGIPNFQESRYVLNARVYQTVPVALPNGVKRIVYFDLMTQRHIEGSEPIAPSDGAAADGLIR
jgi:hypothetical protein